MTSADASQINPIAEAAVDGGATPQEACVVAAIDIGGTKIAGGLVCYDEPDHAPVVSARLSVPTEPQRGGAAVLDSVGEVARRLVEAAGDLGQRAPEGDGVAALRQAHVRLVGIGVGAAGIVDPRDGSVLYANEIMPGWTGQQVKAHLEGKYGLPVAAIGDVQAHALGEARWGAARGAHSCLCVGVGTGLGGAFVLDGRVVTGFRGAAGHIGHTLHPAAAGVPCACGRSAHVETVVSGTAISAAYQGRAFGDELDAHCMGDVVSARAAAGDVRAREVLSAAGFALGEAIGSWCNILDPELVVLSGSVTAAGPVWREALDAGFADQILAPLNDIPLIGAELGADAPLVGAAEHLKDYLGI